MTVIPIKPVIDIGLALESTKLFGQWFGDKSWTGWRTICRAAFGEQLTRTEKKFLASVAGERSPPTKRVKELWCLVGRRAGKDSVASVIATYMAATFKPHGLLRPGERATIACLAVDRTQAAIVLGYIRGYFDQIPSLEAMVEKQTPDTIVLNNGVDILVTTSDFRAARGKSYLAAIFDEAAYWRDEDSSVNPDKEIWRGIRPGMTTLPGSILIGITSVYKRSGLAYERWAKQFGKDSDRTLVIHAPSTALNPTLDQAEIDEAMAEDPVAARADYYSEWRDDLAGYIARDLIEKAVDRGVFFRPYDPKHHYFAFGDTSDGVSVNGDSYTAAIAHREGDMLVLDWVIEIKGRFNTAAATAQVAAGLKLYRVREIMLDRHAFGWVETEFQRHRVKVVPAEIDKSDIYLQVLPQFGACRVRLLDNDRIVAQFCALERRALSGNTERVDHPRGAHDDLANSVAGALYRANLKSKHFVLPQAAVVRARALGQGRRTGVPMRAFFGVDNER